MKYNFAHSILISMFIFSCNSQKVATENQTQEPMTETPHNLDSSNSSFVQPKDPLLGKWQLEYMNPATGRDIKHYKIQKPYLNFVDNAKVAGNNGCNNISGGYEADERKITFHTDKFASTRMFCEGVDEQVYLNALGSVTRYAVMEDGLKLVLSAEDEIVLVFTKVFENHNTR